MTQQSQMCSTTLSFTANFIADLLQLISYKTRSHPEPLEMLGQPG